MNPSDAVDPHETERKPSEQQGLLLNELKGFDSFSARYTVEGEIARGGMGVVFRVWDKKLRRSMAMKVLRDRDDAAGAAEEVAERSPRLLARFLEEAQIMGQIDHPGVVPVHDMGIDDAGRVLAAWDRLVMPVQSRIERRWAPPFGQSILAVGRAPG